MTNPETQNIKWTEVYSLVALSAAIAISWIAYHEYQPKLLQNYSLEHLASFLVVAKGIILIVIPPIAGIIADILIRKSGKIFMVFTVGIVLTAMVFMTVASVLGIQILAPLEPILPVMIVLWLVAMNIFVSPALSMIDSFAPKNKLPIVMGVIFLVTELIYALEPLVVELVEFFGASLTFAVGGILIGGTGYLFQKVSSDEVQERRESSAKRNSVTGRNEYLLIVFVGLLLGVGNAVLVEFIPYSIESGGGKYAEWGSYLSFGLLGLSAILALLASRQVSKIGLVKVIQISAASIVFFSFLLIQYPDNFTLVALNGVIIAIAFSLLNVSGLPYAIERLSARHVTFGVGLFLGASEIAGGILEYMYM